MELAALRKRCLHPAYVREILVHLVATLVRSRLGACRLENLISRFEEPQSSARWDSPLITVPSFDGSLAVAPEGAAEGILGSADAERIWDAITTGDLKPPNVATLPVRLVVLLESLLGSP